VTRIAWVDASVGAAGDMLLAALVDAGVSPTTVAAAVDALGLPVGVDFAEVGDGTWRARRATVVAYEDDPPRRTWRDVRARLDAAPLAEPVRALAQDVFARLARAEARVHGVAAEDVHFHEVGALDALADVVGAAAGFTALSAPAVHVSPVALGGGWTRSAHGRLPVPGPAVLEILREAGAPCYGGPLPVELCTPTGAALLAAVATAWGQLPAMRPGAVGVGAGTRRLPDRPNVVRIVVGEEEMAGPAGVAGQSVLETNVDDLDPRLWPGVLARVLEAGASDAWLVPVLMKKGRPAHTLCALVPAEHLPAVRRAVFIETTALGLREHSVAKTALERELRTVAVHDEPIRVKLGRLDGVVVNAQPEYEDVARAAARLGRPVKIVLAAAVAAAHADDVAGADPP
jgi:pyridinium-3,5-bisthiocarboxylic acid mononucleotide nickel chelatase